MARLLMTVSYGAFLGDLLLVIGSAKNIAVNGVLAANGGTPFGMFEYTHWGLIVLGIGLAYLAGPARLLLPKGKSASSLTDRYRVPKFVTEVLVEASSTLINRSVADIPMLDKTGIAVLGIVRGTGEGPILAPGPYNRVRIGDTLILQGEPDAIVRIRDELGLKARESVQAGDTRLASADVQLVEAVVPAGSDLVGRTLSEAAFRAQTGLNVLGISKDGEIAATPLQHTRLTVGDTLLVQGHLRDLDRTRAERQVIVLSEVKQPPRSRRAWTTVAILAGALAFAVAGLLPLHVALINRELRASSTERAVRYRCT
jgi:K+/H+ antiporter YhaU regulatory subunit KhtT